MLKELFSVLRIVRFANLKIRKFARFGESPSDSKYLHAPNPNLESESSIFRRPESRISNPNLNICKPESESRIRI